MRAAAAVALADGAVGGAAAVVSRVCMSSSFVRVHTSSSSVAVYNVFSSLRLESCVLCDARTGTQQTHAHTGTTISTSRILNTDNTHNHFNVDLHVPCADVSSIIASRKLCCGVALFI